MLRADWFGYLYVMDVSLPYAPRSRRDASSMCYVERIDKYCKIFQITLITSVRLKLLSACFIHATVRVRWEVMKAVCVRFNFFRYQKSQWVAKVYLYSIFFCYQYQYCYRYQDSLSFNGIKTINYLYYLLFYINEKSLIILILTGIENSNSAINLKHCIFVNKKLLFAINPIITLLKKYKCPLSLQAMYSILSSPTIRDISL